MYIYVYQHILYTEREYKLNLVWGHNRYPYPPPARSPAARPTVAVLKVTVP